MPSSGIERPKTSPPVARLIQLAVIFVAISALAVFGESPSRNTRSLSADLGLRLFNDARFSSPQGDLLNSCASCHLLDEDPQGLRARADFFSRSWVPWRTGDPRREELRNSPTILDAWLLPRLHFDGEFASLEDLVAGTLAGRPMGWLPDEQGQAFNRIREVVVKDAGGPRELTYRAAFKRAYGVDVGSLNNREVVELVAKALSDFMRTLTTARSTPFDRFVQANGLGAGPEEGEDAGRFASRFLKKVESLEGARALKLTAGFDAAAVAGMKIFFRADASNAAGNCVTCHTPPLFTDASFHNMGISQVEYDQVHGEGAFAGLQIPAANQVQRPAPQFREPPSKRRPECADLGYWNFVGLKDAARRAREDDDQFLRRMTATFKTPPLRNLAYTNPYMHTGSFATLESALEALRRLSEMARAGKVRDGDEELAKIRIAESDIPALASFLNSLNEPLKPPGKK